MASVEVHMDQLEMERLPLQMQIGGHWPVGESGSQGDGENALGGPQRQKRRGNPGSGTSAGRGREDRNANTSIVLIHRITSLVMEQTLRGRYYSQMEIILFLNGSTNFHFTDLKTEVQTALVSSSLQQSRRHLISGSYLFPRYHSS